MNRILQSFLFLIIPISLFAAEEKQWLAPESYDLSFRATPAMKKFLSHRKLRSGYNDIDKARTIVNLLFEKDGTGFEYHPEITLPPSEAFEQRKGNCITFAMLFTTLARSAGLNTRFNELNTSPGWNQNNDIVIETGHVNVVVIDQWRQFVIEWLDSFQDLSSLGVNTVKDDKIRSDFFSNLGILALAEKEYDIAKTYIDYAKSIDPKNESVWQNEGVIWLHMGMQEKAEQAFLTGIKHTGKNSSLYFLISKLYKQQGKDELAKKYLDQGKRYARKNPFYHYQLAMEDIENNEIQMAQAHLKRAIKIFPNYHLYHFTMAQCHKALGETDKWESELRKAISLTSNPETIQVYQQHLQNLQTTKLD